MLFCAVLWLHCSFFSTPPASPEIYALSLHDALPIYRARARRGDTRLGGGGAGTQLLRDRTFERSEEHTSELQSHHDLVCRLLLEKKNLTRTGATLLTGARTRAGECRREPCI